jgi:hypothetical protein
VVSLFLCLDSSKSTIVLLNPRVSSVSLSADEIEYDELGFISPPDSPCPYLIYDVRILQFRGANISGRWCPKDVSLYHRFVSVTNICIATYLQCERADL